MSVPISEPNPNQTIKTPLDLFHFVLSPEQTLIKALQALHDAPPLR